MAIEGGYVSLNMRDVLADYLQSKGHAPEALIGPRPTLSPGQLPRYPVNQLASDLAIAKTATTDPCIGLAAGQSVQPHHLGVLGYVLQHCQTLAEAQIRLQRYVRLIYDGNAMEFEINQTETVICWGIQKGFHGTDVDDFLHAVMVSYGRRLVGQNIKLSRVELVNPRPANSKPYYDFFGLSPQFEAEATRIGIRNQDLLLGISAPDPALCERLDQAAIQELNKLPSNNNLEADLRDALLPLIRCNDTKLENLATQLGCSARTLQRRLTSSGQSFQEVLDTLRFELARMYMQRPELELVDIALLCGFSEHSAFTRAFSRWAGMPPSDYRNQQLASITTTP